MSSRINIRMQCATAKETMYHWAINNVHNTALTLMKYDEDKDFMQHHELAVIESRRDSARIIIKAMFNWTKWKDESAVGFQMQLIMGVLRPDQDYYNLNTLGLLCKSFAHERDAYLEAVKRIDEECKKLCREAAVV